MRPLPLVDLIVDVTEEQMKFTLLTRDRADYLVDRYSEQKETATALMKRVKSRFRYPERAAISRSHFSPPHVLWRASRAMKEVTPMPAVSQMADNPQAVSATPKMRGAAA